MSKNRDTVESGRSNETRTVWEKFTIVLIEGKPVRIETEAGILWEKNNHKNFNGHHILSLYGREYHIVSVSDKREIVDVIPIKDLPYRNDSPHKTVLSGRSPLAIALLKNDFAKQLGFTPRFTETELKFLSETDLLRHRITHRRFR